MLKTNRRIGHFSGANMTVFSASTIMAQARNITSYIVFFIVSDHMDGVTGDNSVITRTKSTIYCYWQFARMTDINKRHFVKLLEFNFILLRFKSPIY